MSENWEIKSRSEVCAVTGRPFVEGEYFYTLLFHERDGFRREDMSEEAWRGRNDNIQPFSFWRAKFEPPPPPEPEPLGKETAEDLLRRYIEENAPDKAAARFILAVMLERKRLLKQIEAKDAPEGRVLIYEHTKTGEVFVVLDPQLRLAEIAEVQTQVAALLK